jgi:hypothetical protein
MKTHLLFLVIIISLGARAQTDTTELKFDSTGSGLFTPPDSSGFGMPDGKLIAKEIGAAGGTIISDDGRIELVFPEGALASNTTISIQPVTNLAPNGTGKAYQFEPTGTQFKVPVTIIIHYTDEEVKECHPDLLGMGMQDHSGKWEFFDYTDWDSSGKKLVCEINHFSYFSNVKLLSLQPRKSSLHVGSETALVLLELTSKLKNKNGKKRKNRVAHLQLYQTLSWAVNGKPNGDEKVGQVTSDSSARYQGSRQTYRAPALLLLEGNPVTISLTIGIFESNGEYIANQRTLSCNVTIYDQYNIDLEVNGPFDLDCGAELRDVSMFTVKLFANKIEFEKITNTPVTLTKQADCSGESRGGRRGGDVPFKYDPAGCVGPLHIEFDRLTNFEIKNDPPEVKIEFIPRVVKIMKRTGKFPEEKKEGPMKYEEGPTVPHRIPFKADRTIQNFKIGNGSQTVSVSIAPL